MSRLAENKLEYIGHKNTDTFGKTIDDKYELNESSNTDSGFISSGNILMSDEIVSEEIRPISSDISDNTTNKSLKDVEEQKEIETDYVGFDSGTCLSESFSNLDIHDLNDSKIKQEPVKFVRSDLYKQPSIAKVSDDVPWKIFYQQDQDGDTHLHTAIAEGFVEVALALIRIAPHPRLLDLRNDDAQTPLHLAVETAQWRIARWLVVAGARPCQRDLRGDSPLHIAARVGDVKSIRAIVDPVQNEERNALNLRYKGYLQQPCNLDQWNYSGQTCVHVAVLHRQIDALRHLVHYGADINAQEGTMGYSALHYAVERRDEATVQFLLRCKKLNVDIETYGGRNALEIIPILPFGISQALRRSGVSLRYFSDEDVTDSEDSGDELT